MPAGEDKIRSKYFEEGRTHPNRAKKRKTGFEGNNWPSTRTYYSDVPVHIVELAKRFQFYTMLLFKKNGTHAVYFLETISRHLGNYVSNYTIAGLLNKRWGVRHNPKPNTVVAIEKLIEWEEENCRQLKIWSPFNFKYDESHLQKNKQQPYEKETKQINRYHRSIIYQNEESSSTSREDKGGEEEAICRITQQRHAALSRRAKSRQGNKVVGLYCRVGYEVQS